MLPVDNYPAFHDASQFINSAEQDLANVHDNVPLDAGNGSVLYALDPKFPVIEGLERAEARRLWADGPDGCWDVCTRLDFTLTLTDRRISVHHQALISAPLQLPQTLVCLARYKLAR